MPFQRTDKIYFASWLLILNIANDGQVKQWDRDAFPDLQGPEMDD